MAAPAPTPAPAPAPAPAAAPAAGEDGALRALAVQALLATRGTLFEDGSVAILSQQRISGAAAKVLLCVRNKTAAQLTDVELQFAAGGGVSIAPEHLQPTIAAGGQATVLVNVGCVGPVADFPAFAVATGAGVYRALLPVHASSYMEGQELTPDLFVAKWKEWDGERASVFSISAQKVQASVPEVVRRSQPDMVEQVKRQLKNVLHLEELAGMAYGANTFSLTGAMVAQQGRVGILLSFKLQGPSVAVAVRSAHPAVTKAVEALLLALFA